MASSMVYEGRRKIHYKFELNDSSFCDRAFNHINLIFFKKKASAFFFPLRININHFHLDDSVKVGAATGGLTLTRH